jgi:phage terminase small subunit
MDEMFPAARLQASRRSHGSAFKIYLRKLSSLLDKITTYVLKCYHPELSEEPLLRGFFILPERGRRRMAKLTARQNTFVSEYLIDLNATQAAIRAGYSKKTAVQTSSRLLTYVKIQQAVQEAMKNREQRTRITQDKVLTELAGIAFANATDFASIVTGTKKKKVWDDEAGEYDELDVEEQFVRFVDTDSLPPDKKAAVSAIKETRHGLAVESHDKVKALELIGRHFGMFKEKLELSGQVNTNPYEGLTEAELRRLAGDGPDG